jgi:DNA-binding beta-propeller fold protein YncE
MTIERRCNSLALALLIFATLWLASCGGSSLPSVAASTPSPHVLTDQGTTWQVVATADGDVSGLALDGHGHFYAVVNNGIVEFSLQGLVVQKWGAPGSALGQLNQPIRVALDAIGDVYVTDAVNNRIEKCSPTGKPVAQWGASGTSAGEFDFPVGITLDRQGNVFVADFRNDRIQKLSPTGTPLASWGSQGAAPGKFDGGPGGIALDPKGNVYVSEAFDSQGNIYVGDTGNNRVQKLSPSGQFIAQWRGPSTAPFPEPSYITMDEKGNLYVSDGQLILRTCVDSSGCI